MSEKHLTELEWRKFAKGRGLKDGPLVKAMADLERGAKAGPQAQLAALEEMEKQAGALRKGAKGDKELGAYLDELDKALDKQRKLSQADLKKAEAKADGDEEEDSPVLLTTKMIPLIRQVKKGDPMSALVASTGKEVAVMLSRRTISPARRKLMTDYLDGGTAKFFPGTCIWEENAYTFVLKTQAGGLAKKVKAALLKQVELRLKVRVRGEDPNDIDDDGSPADEDEGGGNADASKTTATQPQPDAVPKAPPQPQAPAQPQPGTVPEAPPQPGTIPTPPPLPPDPLKARYDTRMAALEPRVLAALKAQAGDVSKIRAVAEFVRGKALQNEFKSALAGLESLEKLLPAPDAGKSGPENPSVEPGAAFNARLAALMPRVKEAAAADPGAAASIKLKASEAGALARQRQFGEAQALLDELEALLTARTGGSTRNVDLAAWREAARDCLLAWRDAKDAADAGLSRLQSALRGSDDPQLHRIADDGLNGITRNLQVGLRVALEELSQQRDAAGAARAAGLLRTSVEKFRQFVRTDPVVELCDDNPFDIAVDLQSTLGAACDAIDQRLAAVGA